MAEFSVLSPTRTNASITSRSFGDGAERRYSVLIRVSRAKYKSMARVLWGGGGSEGNLPLQRPFLHIHTR